ncbi:LppA family lipoprotein [Mycoplasma feriruminatoris]|uniref:LppA family lipoprotein n=1 Tax=Mycoplasma feriruminatoris TaxID=1179777 RepID=A0AAQ3DQH4_9MOLU|nr:LppA family lipoprotein [Mycoplasma feriruminatoris]WFQ95417.1 LppA family lipoprotein [Mycoplasma feriruminatoris]
MRKFSKLILAILPVSSLTVFSVVSCSTNDKKPIETPKTPVNKIPDNQPKQPENKPESDHKIDKSGGENQPDGEPSPGKPDEQPHNPKQPKEPKQPENNNSSSDNSNEERPQGDEPQGDEVFKNKVDFSDIEKLDNEIKFDFFTTYSKMDARSAWAQIQGRQPAIFKEIVFKNNASILDKYKIEFDLQTFPSIINEKGIIDKVRIKFTKDGESRIQKFIFTGFKKVESNFDKHKNKDEYMKAKEKVEKSLSGLFPSLVAHMLLYTEETQSNNKYDRNIKQTGNVVNFDELINKNLNLFTEKSVGFNAGTKELLFEYNNEYKKIYKDKIVGARYDDINGILELEVQVSNREDYENQNDPTKNYKFTFPGFRKIDFNNPNKNVLSISLQQRGLKKLIDDNILKTIINQLTQHNHFNHKVPIWNINENNLKNELFEKLTVDIIDDVNNLYRSTQTLKIDLFKKDDDNKSILGIKNQMSLYPFHTRITKDSIKAIYATINNKNTNKELELEVEINIPIYSSTLTDLTDQTYAEEKTLKIVIKQSSEIK